MSTRRKGHGFVEGTRNAFGRVYGTGSRAVGGVARLIGRAGNDGAARLPDSWGSFRHGAESTVTSLQKMPDDQLGLFAAASAGLGAGLGIAGAPRLVTFAGFACASILGFAMVSRPRHAVASPSRG